MASFNSHSIHKCSVSKYSHFVLGLQYVDGRDQIQSLAQLPILAQGPGSSLFRSAPGMERCTIVQTIGMGAASDPYTESRLFVTAKDVESVSILEHLGD